MTWKNIGGGCGVSCRGNYPCDDMYQNEETGERVVLYSTMEAHFALPATVDDPETLRQRDGVQKPWEQNDHMSCGTSDDEPDFTVDPDDPTHPGWQA